MADEPPVTAAFLPTPPRRRNRRRQRSQSNGQTYQLHPLSFPAMHPVRPAQMVANRWVAALEEDVDGWTLTPEDRDKLLERSPWTADRGTPMSKEQECPTCLLCCETFKVVAFGQCGHKEICAECIFQMVTLYKNSKCPLCMAELNKIMITHWPGPDTRSLSDWTSLLDELWHDHQWSPCFFIAHTTFPGTSQTLHAHFQQLTATACSVCDPQANHPFQSDSALCKHMIRQHDRHLCRLCLRARQQAFPLQQPTYTAPDLHAHMAAEHPQCRFCHTRFLDEEKHQLHMMETHPYCELCDDDFRDAAEFTEHLGSKHWLCQECEGCFVAFEHKADLVLHQRTVHAPGNPQQDRGEEQIMAWNVFTPLLHDPSLPAPVIFGDGSIAAVMDAIRQAVSSTTDLRSGLQSSATGLQSSLQRLTAPETSHLISAPGSRLPGPTSSLSPLPPQQRPQQRQQQPQAHSLMGPPITYTWPSLLAVTLNGTGPGSGTARSSISTGNPQRRAGQPQSAGHPQRRSGQLQHAAAASHLGPAVSAQTAAAAGAARPSRPLSQAEINERIASRTVQPYEHRGTEPVHSRAVPRQSQPEHTVRDQSGQRGMGQPEQPQDRSFLGVFSRTIASDPIQVRADSHVSPPVSGPRQVPESAPDPPEPQSSQLDPTGRPNVSNPTSGWWG